MSQTPTKSKENSFNYTPKEITTPNKGNNEISKTIFMRVSSLHNLLSNWIKLIDKGTKICKTISALKLHECEEFYYPHQTKTLTENLLEILDGLKNIVDAVEMLNNQLKALTKLQPQDCPVILTWNASKISEHVSRIYGSLQKEYALKLVIIENIAHCREESLIEVYVSAWEFDVYLDTEYNEYLFAETGVSKIT